MTELDALNYEAAQSYWWVSLIWWEWGQRLASKYLVRKVRKKFNHYLWVQELRQEYRNLL